MSIYNYLIVQSAHAQTSAPQIPITGQQISLAKLIDLVKQVATFLIQVAPIFAVIFIIWGGITYMAAGANEEKSKAAKARIKNAIIGAFVIFGVGLILQTISGFISNVSLQ